MAIAGTFGPETIKATGIALIVVTSLVAGTRFAGSIRGVKDIRAEDCLLLVAYVFFLELSILYIFVAPTIFRLSALENGLINPYPTVMDDSLQLQTVFFVTTSSLWICLWMVKFSLLSMYKRLLVGKTYVYAWWGITIACALFLIGCILSSWFSCSSFHAWFTAGACGTPRDIRAATISLYYAYAVDIVTDLAIMALPIRLIWHLKMQLKQKLSIGGLFCFGWICIIIATIRVVQLGSRSNGASNGQPAPSWLALWGIIESAIAVMIGCCPGLYRVVKSVISPSKPSYAYGSYNNAHGRRMSGMPSHKSGSRNIAMTNLSGKETTFQTTSAYRSSSPSSSQEHLARGHGRGVILINHGIEVTVDDRNDDFDQMDHGRRHGNSL
ncbi:Uncharacterized protein PECH_001331 [Penicillium ucsense]|uniref:Rhodopsin domain-containing protein n=1 Tax=Penicillium ucsense TaxID=2839758 RepID=A0A8J8VX89_9EURO|nr:Uncharacterized protein PECM_001218 [Penicillium ucsense]KAF7732961.1 Uncharacterized protein PECH_001331 [Penicillium ucsense]